jgi:hypothetical protein
MNIIGLIQERESRPERALRLLENLAARLDGEHPGAAVA